MDGSDLKRADVALRASEMRYRRLFESAKDGILILSAESGLIVDVNPFLMELTGFSREEFLGKHLWEIGPFRDVAASKESFAELRAQKYVRYDDLPLMTSDRGTIDVEFVSNVYRAGDQDVVQCNIRDISARKRAERERGRLTAAIEQVDEMVFVTDARGDIVYVNPAFEAVTGYPQADVLGRNPRLLKSDVQDETYYRELWSTISGGRTWRGRVVNRKRDGTLYTATATISPVRGASGVVTSYVAVQRDITRELALEAQVVQMQKMEGIGRLAGGVAHDFNNLLTVILGCTGIAMRGVPEGDPRRNTFLEIEKAGLRAAVLTRQLLAFSRKQVLQPVLLDANQVVAGIEKMFRRILGEDIDFVQVLAPDLGVTRADPGQIEQMLMNLVVNARDAMPRGGRLTIDTDNVELDEDYAVQHPGVKPGLYIAIAVSDTGCGMDAQTKSKLFEPFFTTKAPGHGTGLGLSTVYGIVTQSGGHVSVYSELGQGATFRVYLPREPAGSRADAAKPATRPPRLTGTETILVVEDEEALREVIRRILAEAGYAVLTAANGDEALLTDARSVGDIDLLLTDVVMPGMDGKTLSQSLSRKRPKLKLLFMSGYTDDAIVHHGVLDVGTQFIGKPFTAADLMAKVREVLDAG